MEEILYLEPDEEITSVIDKLQKSNSDSVGLVIPRDSGLIHSAINLKLLKKKADSLNKDIALVTADKIGKNIASQVGIKVFEDVHAQKPANNLGQPPLPKGDEVIEVNMSGEDLDDNNQPSTNLTDDSGEQRNQNFGRSSRFKVKRYTIDSSGSNDVEQESTQSIASHADDDRLVSQVTKPVNDRRSSNFEAGSFNKGLLVFVGIFVLLIVSSLLFLPQSAIDVIVTTEPFENIVSLTVDQSIDQPIPQDKKVPGKLLETVNDDAKRVVATGRKDVGGKAKGTVTISNSLQSDPFKLTAGTVLTHTETNKGYALDKDISIPGATLALKDAGVSITPGTLNATVTASEPGDSFNVKSGNFTIGGITAKQQEKITAKSSADFIGGFTKTVNTMTQGDIDSAKEALLVDLNNQALEQFKKEAKDLKLINEAVYNEVISFETNPAKVDTETDFFDLKVKAKHKVMVFNEKEVQAIVDSTIREQVPTDKELLLGDGDEFVVSVAGKDYEALTLELESKIKTKIGSRIDVASANKGLNGKNEAQLREQLSTLPNVKEINLFKFPRWWWQDTSYAPWNTHLKIIYQ